MTAAAEQALKRKTVKPAKVESKAELEHNAAPGKLGSEGGTTITDPLPGFLGGGEYTIGGKSVSQDAAEVAKKIEALRKTNPAEAKKLEAEQTAQAPGIEKENNEKNTSWEEKLNTFLGDVTSGSTWIRILEVLGGGALVLFGLYVIVKKDLPKAVPVPV